MRIFASHNPNPTVREASSAGGIFSLLAAKVIKEDGVVYGVGFDQEWNIAYHRVEALGDLPRLYGSKYAFSQLGSTVASIEKDLKCGRRVLFSGTPCQAAAIKKRIGDNDNLLVVEVVCHGAPDHKYWQKYLMELCSKIKKDVNNIFSISFRDKRTGWKGYSFTITFKDGKTFSQVHDDNLYMRAFVNDLTVREGCFHCPFKYPDGSQADITLGDFWGITQVAPEIDNDLGTTVVIVRTPKGEIFTSMLPCDKDLTLDEASRYNKAITTPPAPSPLRNDFLDCFETKGSLMRALKRYADQPLSQKLYLKAARFKNRLFRFCK